MTKTIKFNLILDGKPVRDLEGLQQNYNLDDIYANFQSGVLARWLEVRGYEEQLTKVKAVKSTEEMNVAKELAKIFDVTPSDAEIKKSVYAIQFRKEEKEKLEKLEKAKFEHNLVISHYHAGYEKLLFDMIEHKEDFNYIKQSIKEINDKYFKLFQLNYMNFYYKMINEAPLAIFAVLMHENLRGYFIARFDDNSHNDNPIDEISNLFNDRLKAIIKIAYSRNILSEFLVDFNNINIAKDEDCYLKLYFKIFGGITDGYWKDIEPKGKKFMIITLEEGSFVRNAGVHGEELAHNDVWLEFPILDGIDYKSNNANHKLIYMEV